MKSEEKILIHAGRVNSANRVRLLNSMLEGLGNEPGEVVISVEGGNKEKTARYLERLPEGVEYMLLPSGHKMSGRDKLSSHLFFDCGIVDKGALKLFKRESKRLFKGRKFSRVVIFRCDDVLMMPICAQLQKKDRVTYMVLPDHIMREKRADKMFRRMESLAPRFCSWETLPEGYLYDINDVNYNKNRVAEIRKLRYDLRGGSLRVSMKLRIPWMAGIDAGSFRIKVSQGLYDVSTTHTGGQDYRLEFSLPAGDVLSGTKNKWVKLRFLDPNGRERLARLRPRTRIEDRFDLRYYLKADKTIEADSDGSVILFLHLAETLTLTTRGRNVTDSRWQHIRVDIAYLAARFYRRKKIILMYEKNLARYEEGGSIVYEALIDKGYTNVFFILDKNCPYRDSIDPKYRGNIIDAFSMKHYIYSFCARSIISSESLVHLHEKSNANRLMSLWPKPGRFDYVFLQHGVMYMISLDAPGRGIFSNNETNGKVRIVVSSDLEKKHFMELGGYREEQLYLCGLPKFDRCELLDGADKIVIMLTWRPWEYAQYVADFNNTSYVRTMERMIAGMPPELLDKLVIIGHPLLKEFLRKHEDELSFSRYVSFADKYDDLLKETRVLITDWSSISYDAFYRGSNVIFYWEEKEDCLAHYGGKTKLMLTDELAFGDVCRDASALGAMVSENYRETQKPEHVERYSRVVSFHDGRNTERLLEFLKKDKII